MKKQSKVRLDMLIGILYLVHGAGGKVTRDAGPVKGGKTVIAFVEDPTGYKWELITREEPIPEPIAQVGSYLDS